MLKSIVSASILFALTTTAARAVEPLKLGELQAMCAASDEVSRSACKFFIFGLALGADAAAAQLGDHTHLCLPGEPTAEKIARTVTMHMSVDLVLDPRDREMPAVKFVLATMTQQYQCRNDGSR